MSWLEHVKKTMRDNPGKSFKQIMKIAKITYKKGGVTLSAPPPPPPSQRKKMDGHYTEETSRRSEIEGKIVRDARNLATPMGEYQILERVSNILRDMNEEVSEDERNDLISLFRANMPPGTYRMLARQGGRNKTRRGRKSQRKTRAKRRV
jgi:hypothetical protein